LRHLIELRARDAGQDATGAPNGAWVTEAAVWAKVENISGREALLLQQIVATATLRVTIRYRDGVTTEKRFKDGDRIFQITGIDIEPAGVKQWLVCQVREIG